MQPQRLDPTITYDHIGLFTPDHDPAIEQILIEVTYVATSAIGPISEIVSDTCRSTECH